MMRNPGLKCAESPHNMLLSSIAKDFIHKKRSIPNSCPRMQVYRNEISITYEPADGSFRELPFNHQDFKAIIDEVTKKMRLYKMKSLESFSLNFISCQGIPNESLRYLKQNLMKHSPGLKRLALSFYGARTKSNKGMEAIAELIFSFKDLESLQIRLFASDCGQDKHLNTLIKKVQKSHRFMKDLQIDMSSEFESHYDDMQFVKRDLFQALTWWDHTGASTSDGEMSKKCALKMPLCFNNNFQGLQSLNLMLHSMFEISDKFCLQLGKRILEKMTHLKSLNLDFSECRKITNQGLSLFNKTPTSKRKLRALDHLALNFSGLSNIDDMGLKKLGQGITQQFKDLKKLALTFDPTDEVSEDGLVKLNAKIASNLKSLQSFTLAARSPAERNPGCAKKIIQDIFGNLKQLKELSLLCFGITGDELSAISSELEDKKNKQELEKLHLLRIEAKGNDLSKFFKIWKTTTLKDLTELKLDFSGNDYVSVKMVVDLGKALETMTKLKRLALLFDECKDLGKHEKSSLVPLIPQTSVLETFEVSFRRCFKITDQHVDGFGASLCQHQKKLTLLDLNFCYCTNITEKTLKKLCYGIKHDMKEMLLLTLNFKDVSKISGGIKNEMKIKLIEIPAVTLY